MANTAELLKRYKQALEGLTPGGSEFVDDPEFCAAYVRRTRQSQHETIIRQQLRIKALSGPTPDPERGEK